MALGTLRCISIDRPVIKHVVGEVGRRAGISPHQALYDLSGSSAVENASNICEAILRTHHVPCTAHPFIPS